MTEFTTAKDGVRIAYEVVGEGTPVMLVHGFGSSRRQNWQETGWYATLTGAGYQVIAMDCRGHGESDKPHEPEAYDHTIMKDDVLAVLDAAGAGPVRLMGYSMGGYISIHVLMAAHTRVERLVIGGVGATYFRDGARGADDAPAVRMGDPVARGRVADALLAADKTTITDPGARMFRDFADQPGKDRFALAACMRAPRRNFTPAELAGAGAPVLVVCGENDNLTGPPGPLAAAFGNGNAVTVPRRDHMTTVGDKVYKQAVLKFFENE